MTQPVTDLQGCRYIKFILGSEEEKTLSYYVVFTGETSWGRQGKINVLQFTLVHII